jgi:16S rRNA (guanine(966)-N(2))-methyltransferase RsmD
MGEIRIIGGSHKRRVIKVSDVVGVRPSPNRVRETLFNWLGQDLTGWTVLDLFAGSGALGFEAASRGAGKVVMIEQHPSVLKQLEQNRSELKFTQVQITQANAREWPKTARDQFDLVLADPPFSDPGIESILQAVSTCIKASGMVYLETPMPVPEMTEWSVFRAAKAGQVFYQLLQPQLKRVSTPLTRDEK